MLHSKQYIIKRVNDPEASLSSFKNTALTKEEIIKNDSVIVMIPDCLLRFPVMVVGFNMTIASKDAALNISNSSMIGNHISPVIIEIIKQLQPGDKILFDHIVGWGASDTWVGSFFITIK